MKADKKNPKPESSGIDSFIHIHGARVHNLQNLDVDIPRDQLVVITGPSGSGKSSLALDTLFAEGQRQYIESLSVYARQFFQQLQRPDVDLIEGLQPTIAIDQRAGSHNPRSTVGTITDIYDYLRLLMARLGEVTCYRCGLPICRLTPEQIQETLLQLPERTKVMIMAPMVDGRRGKHQDVFARIRKAGFVRARIDGKVYDIDDVPDLAPRKFHNIEAVVDRIVIREGIESRLAESIDLAVEHGEGRALATYQERSDSSKKQGVWRDELFSTLHACPKCNISYAQLESRTFSFNSPYGACPMCDGLGVKIEFDPDLVLPDKKLSLETGAVAAFKALTPSVRHRLEEAVRSFALLARVDLKPPIENLEPDVFEQLLYGEGKGAGEGFPGVLVLLEKQYATTTRRNTLQRLEAFRGSVACADCGGARLRPEARSVRIGDKAIHEITAMGAADAKKFFELLTFWKDETPIAEPIVSEITSRLGFLEKVGLEYLTLDRPADTLSGGEMQRVRLASSIGSALVGVCYVLDEPTIGLHQRDNQRLIDALRNLQQQGNTVVVVEHDEAIMRQADHLIDLGPKAGLHGGKIVSQGTVQSIIEDAHSITGRYLAGDLKIPIPEKRRRALKSRSITIDGVSTNNLKSICVRFPLSVLISVTGVSGSGKSSLLNETLAPALVRRLSEIGPKSVSEIGPKPGPFTSLRGTSQINKLVQIDQSPIGRTPRSNPATYTGLFDEIRKIFTSTHQARQRGYKVGRFSFNMAGGRCEPCQGHGRTKIEMNFLPDLYVTCPVCRGARFNRQTLEVKFRDKSIADVLDLSVEEAADFFQNIPAMARMLQCLLDVGLGYLTLGQPSTTLSGGEAQRIKLATELGRANTGNTLYTLDEPTTGLHFDDIKNLLNVLGRLVDVGNTVIVIEHHLDVIKSADWIIDLGPEGGERGGELVAAGTPEEIAAIQDNYTGQFLRPLLGGKSR